MVLDKKTKGYIGIVVAFLVASYFFNWAKLPSLSPSKIMKKVDVSNSDGKIRQCPTAVGMGETYINNPEDPQLNQSGPKARYYMFGNSRVETTDVDEKWVSENCPPTGVIIGN